MVYHHMAWIHGLFICATVAGVVLAFLRCLLPDGTSRIASAYVIGEVETTEDKLVYLITRLGWPPLFWLQAAVSAMTPFVCLFSMHQGPEKCANSHHRRTPSLRQRYLTGKICLTAIPRPRSPIQRNPRSGCIAQKPVVGGIGALHS